MQSVRDKQTLRNLADNMAGIFEHNRARPGKPILIGTVTAEAMDRWRNRSCEVCEKITHTCKGFWEHHTNSHHITSNNMAIFHQYVQHLINTALEPNSAHFIVTLTKCAQTLGVIDVTGFHDDGAEDVTILQHLDPFGHAIVKEHLVPAIDGGNSGIYTDQHHISGGNDLSCPLPEESWGRI